MPTKPMLPLVDPDYLILERDPDKLRAYARGLLYQLRNPSRSYSLEMVKAATVWLRTEDSSCLAKALRSVAPS